MVVIDDHSRYPVVEVLPSTSAKSVMPLFDKIFSLFGIPEELKTDNGPPFQSFEFRQFAEELGFRHHRITPKANGEAERFMRTHGKAIRTTHIESKSWKQEMYSFLRNYRATPHSSTNLSPAKSLLNRKMRTKLPELKEKKKIDILSKDRQAKEKMKMYADTRNNAKKSYIKEGDTVLVKTPKENKL